MLISVTFYLMIIWILLKSYSKTCLLYYLTSALIKTLQHLTKYVFTTRSIMMNKIISRFKESAILKPSDLDFMSSVMIMINLIMMKTLFLTCNFIFKNDIMKISMFTAFFKTIFMFIVISSYKALKPFILLSHYLDHHLIKNIFYL